MVFATIDFWLTAQAKTLALPKGGFQSDQVSFMFCFLTSILLGWVQWMCVRGRVVRHLFSMVIGLFLAIVQYGLYGLVSFALTSSAVYLLLLLLPRSSTALPVFVLSFSYLSGMHIYRMVTDYLGWGQDPTNLQMILTCKLTSFAYAFQDGETIIKHPEKLSPEQKEFVIEELPTFLEYFGYLCFFPGFLSGPVFEFKDYRMYINESGVNQSIPNPVLPSMKLFFQAVLCGCIANYGLRFFPHNYCITHEFETHTLLYKFLYCNAAMIACKFRYYCGFKLGEAGLVASGFGFNGYSPTGQTQWNRASGVNALKSEFGETTKVMTENWNISVSLWFRRYVYTRIAPPGSSPQEKSRSQHITFILSAFWHGFYPGYYLFFFFFSVLSEVTKMFYVSDFSGVSGRETLKPVLWVLMYLTGNFIGMPFLALGLSESLRIYNSVYWLPILGTLLCWCFFHITKLHLRHRKPT